MSRLLYIAPVRIDDFSPEREFEDFIRPENHLSMVGFSRGPLHLEYHYYEALVLPDLVHTVVLAEQQGFDAAVIGCFYDLGLDACREMTEKMVVTAPCESSTLLAASLGSQFSIIVGRKKWIPQMRETVRAYGLDSRLASFRTIDLGVPDYHRDQEETERRFEREARRAIEEDGAEVIILGCTASAGYFKRLQERLQVPVIDSGLAAITHAEHLVHLRESFGWAHSKQGTYASPPAHELDAWGLSSKPASQADSLVWEKDGVSMER